jgi:hypothetical protein
MGIGKSKRRASAKRQAVGALRASAAAKQAETLSLRSHADFLTEKLNGPAPIADYINAQEAVPPRLQHKARLQQSATHATQFAQARSTYGAPSSRHHS